METRLTKDISRSEVLRIASEKELLPKLQGEVAMVFNTLHTPLIKEVDDVVLSNKINDGIAKASLSLGLKASSSDEGVSERLTLVKLITEDFRKHWLTFSIGEIDLFFDFMAKGMLGEVLHITQSTVFICMGKYWSAGYRQEAHKQLFELKEIVLNPTIHLSEEDKDNISKDAIIKRFEQFEQALRMNSSMNLVSNGSIDYDYLDKKKIIDFTKELKTEAWNKAKQWISEQKRNNADPQKVSDFTKNIAGMNKAGLDAYAIVVSKEMLLSDAYKKLINRGSHIKELL